MTQLPNPKDLLGSKKVPLFSVVPTTGMVYEALAMWDGAEKYGPFNWREHPVLASVYLDALARHVMAFAAGQDIDPKSGKPHLGHAKACLGILIDAFETGNLIDDRVITPSLVALLDKYDRSTPPTTNKDQTHDRSVASVAPGPLPDSPPPAATPPDGGGSAPAR